MRHDDGQISTFFQARSYLRLECAVYCCSYGFFEDLCFLHYLLWVLKGPNGNGRTELLYYIAELHPCYSYEHRFPNQLPLLRQSDRILLQLAWRMTRVTAGDCCHLISKHSANGWLTSPDATNIWR